MCCVPYIVVISVLPVALTVCRFIIYVNLRYSLMNCAFRDSYITNTSSVAVSSYSEGNVFKVAEIITFEI